MSKEKMTLHKALGELKVLESRINDATIKGVFIVTNKHSNQKIDGMTVNDYEEKVMKPSYQRVVDLIDRRKKIKDALTKKNAEIEFEIAGETFTIATAIDRKNTMQNEKNFLNQMVAQYNNATAQFNKVNANLEDEALREAQKFFEDKDNVDTTKVKSLQQDYVESRKLDLIDPLGLREKIENLDQSIVDFSREIDYKLSELNATNFIEV